VLIYKKKSVYNFSLQHIERTLFIKRFCIIYEVTVTVTYRSIVHMAKAKKNISKIIDKRLHEKPESLNRQMTLLLLSIEVLFQWVKP